MANIERINQKIALIKERRDKVEVNIKKLTEEAKQLNRQMDELESNMKLLRCGQFKDLLERNAISIKDVDFDAIVRVISENKDAFAIKNASAIPTTAQYVNETEEAEIQKEKD